MFTCPRAKMKGSQQENDHSSKGLAKGINIQLKVGYLAMWIKCLKKECLYHIIKYAHVNVVLNKSLGKF